MSDRVEKLEREVRNLRNRLEKLTDKVESYIDFDMDSDTDTFSEIQDLKYNIDYLFKYAQFKVRDANSEEKTRKEKCCCYKEHDDYSGEEDILFYAEENYGHKGSVITDGKGNSALLIPMDDQFTLSNLVKSYLNDHLK